MDKTLLLKKIPANSPLAYFFLAFIGMAGLSYINFLPGVVNALAGGIGFSDAEAGQVVALNGYGGLVGSTAAIFLVHRIHWQGAMFLFLAVLTVIDAGTVWVDDYSLMLGWRFLAGIVGGLCVGIAFSVLARLNNPDRAFGLLLFVQFSIGSIVIYLLPGLEALLHAHAVFYIMATFVMLSLVCLLFLPAFPIDSTSIRQAMPLSRLCGNTLLLLLAIILYQCAASAIWAYVGLIGLGANIVAESVSIYIATTGLLGLLGAMLPVISGNRFGRLYWLIAGVALSTIAAVLLSTSQLTPFFYVISMAMLFFSWPAVQSYLLAVTAEMDSSGRLSTVAAVVSSVGLASGPLLASSLLDNGNFSVMLYTCAIIFLLSVVLLFKPVQAQEKINNRGVKNDSICV
jgi:predicted MFS family arabinose efflux permease